VTIDRSLKFASCRGGWGECSCPRSATAIHSVTVDQTPNLGIERGGPITTELLPPATFAAIHSFSSSLFCIITGKCAARKRTIFICYTTHFETFLLCEITTSQGRNKVRWRPGQKTNSAPPWSNRRPHGRSLAPPWSILSSFEGKFTVLKKVLVTLLGLLGASSSNSAPLQWSSAPIVNWPPGDCVPLAPPRYAPATSLYLCCVKVFIVTPVTRAQVTVSFRRQGCGVGGKISYSDLSKIST